MDIRRYKFFILFLSFLLIVQRIDSQVTVTEKNLTIPTYEVMDPDPNPVFFNGRRYQGAQGRVYPYPLTHNLSDSLTDRDYHAVIIENEYVEICILPELGGRIYYALDKSNDYYFLYYNRVIKPALIGMTGAWISGGVEWNIPHHHRASSFMPVEHSVTENGDGSKTVWVGETEWRHRTRWIVGITLYPGSTLVETTVRMFNTTPIQNSILIWANAAVHANENYQVFFPPKTQYATYHRKNQFSEWPVSRQRYDGADYTEGVDVSRWVNHIKSTSFFEWGNNGNFVAGIDHGQQAGTVIFGDKYVNPGKKMWSWGNNPSGAMWDGLLTDEDGPYIELMFGSYSDNQPDYSWVQALETKESIYWFAPLKGMKGIRMANTNAMIDVGLQNDTLLAVVNPVMMFEDAEVMIYLGDKLLFDEVSDLDPAEPFRLEIKLEPEDLDRLNRQLLNQQLLSQQPLNRQPVNRQQENRQHEDPDEELNGNHYGADIFIEVVSSDGITLAYYRHELPEQKPMPEPVSAPVGAGEISDPGSLYYAGLKFEQFHDPYYMPMDFYLKALEIDPLHIPSLTRAGMLYLKAGDYENASELLSIAVDRVSSDYIVPENGAPLYYLGLAYVEMGMDAEAYELFQIASWDYSFRAPSLYQLALADSRRGYWFTALRHLTNAWYTNTRNPDILALAVSMDRITGNRDAALRDIEILLDLDPLNYRAHYEKYLVTGNRSDREDFIRLMRDHHENWLELAVDYGNSGLIDNAVDLLEIYNQLPDPDIRGYPVVNYYLGYYNHLAGNEEKAGEYFEMAAGGDYRYCFPFRFETLRALETALEYDPGDALAWYLIGNIWYDHQPGRAVEAWEQSVAVSDEIPVAYRNIAFAYANIDKDPVAAIENIEKALSLNPNDARYYYEYDLYRKTLLEDPAIRVEPFIANHDVVSSDRISIFPYAELLTITGNYDQAIELMRTRHFHRWEGGESVYLYWLYAHIFKAVAAIENNNLTEAGLLLDAALSYPQNLQSVSSAHEPIAWYYKGLLAEKLKQTAQAESFFMEAVHCRTGAPECDYFAAKAYEKLKKKIASESIFESMIKIGEEELLAEEDMDFFDPFATVRSKHEIQANAYFRIALGYHGQGDLRSARRYFSMAKEHNPALISLVFAD